MGRPRPQVGLTTAMCRMRWSLWFSRRLHNTVTNNA